jgi:hypothetical protein
VYILVQVCRYMYARVAIVIRVAQVKCNLDSLYSSNLEIDLGEIILDSVKIPIRGCIKHAKFQSYWIYVVNPFCLNRILFVK